MARANKKPPRREPTPVDDVRLIRERLSREAGNDVYVLSERSQKIAEGLAASLGLKRVRTRKRILRRKELGLLDK